MMKAEPNQERLKELLKETITLLCKNGLQYNSQFSVEGLIVVTLDKDTVFHANINEVVKVPGSDDLNSEGDEQEEDAAEVAPDPSLKSRRRKRKKPSYLSAPVRNACEEEDSLTGKSSPACPAERDSFIKSEPNDSDLIIIKEELSATAFSSAPHAMPTNSFACGPPPGLLLGSPQVQSTTQMPNFPNLAMGAQPQLQMPPNMLPEGSIAQSWPTEQTPVQSNPGVSQNRVKRRFNCHLCEKSYTDRRHLRSHLFSLHGYGEPLKCRDCGQVFKWRVSLTTHKNHCKPGNSKSLSPMSRSVDDLKQKNLKYQNPASTEFQPSLVPIDIKPALMPSDIKLSLMPSDFQPSLIMPSDFQPSLLPSDFQPNLFPSFDQSSSEVSHQEDEQSEELKEPLICIECGEVFKRMSSLLAHKMQCSQHFTPLEGPSDRRVHVSNHHPMDLSQITADSCT